MKTFNIGRNASNDIILNDKMVSRRHAQLIVLDNGQVIIKDLGSSNGTFVNGNKVVEWSLKPGDIVKCGSTFVKWTQYISEGSSFGYSAPNQDYAQESINQNLSDSDIRSNSEQSYNLSESLKFLSTKVFNVGDLFKSEWDRTPSILFFLLTPLVITLIAGLYFYSKFSSNFSYQVILPVIIVIFLFGVAQFLTLLLLSINKETTLIKNIFASSIFSFLQFMIIFISSLLTIPALAKSGVLSPGISDFFSYYILLFLAIITGVTCLTITLITFIYKYFRIIGVSNGISVHLTVFTFTINLLFQIAFAYFFISITNDNLMHFKF